MEDRLRKVLIEREKRRLRYPYDDWADKYSDASNEFRDLLRARRRRLNAEFRWTDENVDRFKFINERLFNACKEGWAKGMAAAEEFEEKIKQGDSFINDYEIAVSVSAYPAPAGELEWDSETSEYPDPVEELIFYLGEEAYDAEVGDISHCHWGHEAYTALPFMDTGEETWCSEFFGARFEGYYVCHMIYALMDSRVWSIPDILSINRVFVDVTIRPQSGRDLPKWDEDGWQVGSPFIGPFFYMDGDFLSHRIPVDEGVRRVDKVDNPYSHEELYMDRYPYSNREYIDFPRGRVVWDAKKSRAIIYIDPCIEKKDGAVERVVYLFGLRDYVVEHDEHYSCSVCIGDIWEDD
ncbi:MAG: hypothetical protein FWG09_04685 [Synergistaceae bacterium]|nr:hypothetical protein [Synergistaceae bacterium]